MTEQSPAEAGDDAFEWAIVEIMGHRKLYGRVREEEKFGAKMLRIDVPKPTVPRTLFDAAEGKPEEPSLTWVTQWYGGPSIFSLTLTDESTVLRANQPYAPAQRYIAPPDRYDDGEEEEPVF
ncbi:hypothetical protein [Allomesorhizobium alhagi]|nr:hypothetical protein [Mesorhizobium alhagi]